MPILDSGIVTIDYSDDGEGVPVVLIHGSASSNGQWRSLVQSLKDRYRVLAINLFGYGKTTPWPTHSPQSLYAQAQLVMRLCDTLEQPVHMIGHSFGGSVALKSALALDSRVKSLTLLEPNPFYLLRQNDRRQAFLDARALRDHVKCYGALDDWETAAAPFADYWLGDGAWASMTDKGKAAFSEGMHLNYIEWDAVMDEQTTLAEWKTIHARTLMVSDKGTRRPIREIVELFVEACPHWAFRYIEGGHMAPLTRPKVVNPVVREFIDSVG